MEVCVVDVKRGNKPLFIKVRDKNGQKFEQFFIRSGNSSPPIEPPSEILSDFIIYQRTFFIVNVDLST